MTSKQFAAAAKNDKIYGGMAGTLKQMKILRAAHGIGSKAATRTLLKDMASKWPGMPK